MKTLLAVLQLTVLSQVPAQDSEKKAPAPPAEKKRVTVIEFDDDTMDFDGPAPEWGCFPDREGGRRRPLVRIREDFADKVMQSVDEM
jgi:hypothetical protein